jgi:hypothetical protein
MSREESQIIKAVRRARARLCESSKKVESQGCIVALDAGANGAIRSGNMLKRSVTAIALLVSVMAAGAAFAQEPKTDVPEKSQSDQSSPPASAATTAATSAVSEQSKKSDAPKTASNSAPLATVVVNGGPSADILRSARNAGFKIKVVDGKTHFCKTEAPIGSRFPSESCMNEQQVTLWLDRAQDQREKIQNMVGAPASVH